MLKLVTHYRVDRDEEMEDRDKLRTVDLYKSYQSEIDSVDKGSVYDVPYATFAKVLELANHASMEAMIHDNVILKLPYRMGEVSIKKYKQKVAQNEDGTLNKRSWAVDWKETKQLWAEDEDAKERKILVYHLNRHTGGYKYMWHWYRGVSNIKNVRLYKFYPLRKWKRGLASLLLDPVSKIDFYEK